MLLKYLLLPLLFATASETLQHNIPVLSAAELLMNKKWVLTSYGFDENGNGRIEIAEERIEECEKDDTYEFNTGGNGMMRDNGFTCCNGIDEQSFQWQFTNNSQSLEVFHDTIHIQRLTTRELITSKRPSYIKGQVLNFITIYRIK